MKIRKEKYFIEYFKIFPPLLFSILASFMFSIIDTLFISTLGETEIAGIGLLFPIIIFVLAIFGSLSNGIGINVSTAFGANLKERLKIKIFVGTLMSFILSLLLFIFLFTFKDFIFSLLKAPKEVLEVSLDYFNIWVFIILIEGVSTNYAFSLNSVNLVKTKTLIAIFSLFLNTILDYILIFGFYDIPPLGVKGAAYASFISIFVGLLLYMYVLYSKGYLIYFYNNFLKMKLVSKKIIFLAIPFVLNGMMYPIGLLSINIVLSKFPVSSIAAYSLFTRMEYLFLIVSAATSISLSILVSKYIGSKKYSNIVPIITLSNKIVIIWSLFIFSIAILFGKYIGSLFLETDEAINMFYDFWIIMILGNLSWGLMGNIIKIFMVLNQPYYTIFTGLLRMTLYIVLPIYGSYHYQEYGFIVAISFTNILLLVVTILLYKKYIKTGKLLNKNLFIN